MAAPELLLAYPDRIGDNIPYDEFDWVLGPDMTMDGETGRAPVWGTGDKARLAELISLGRGGDMAAVESLYEMFKRPIFNLAYRHTMNRAVAEDLLQDAFLKVFANLGSVRDAETFPGWVYRIALNTCYSHLRQKKARGEKLVSLTDLEGRVEEPGGEPVEKDVRGPLDEAVRSLPPRLRSVFVLHDVQGYKHREVSRLLGCSIGTSKSQLFKARMKVRDFLRARKAV
jgi:RNA polymerase sigma-70 factor (ECF subfamily)